jgi:hypothetical protein
MPYTFIGSCVFLFQWLWDRWLTTKSPFREVYIEYAILGAPWVVDGLLWYGLRAHHHIIRLPASIYGISLVLTCVIALWACQRTLKRARTLGGTPASRHIASTAQGYTRLTGCGRPLDGTRVFEPGSGVPCLWRRTIYRNGNERVVDESDTSFLLDDGSGTVCAVDPEGAEMLVQRHRAESFGNAIVEYWLLRAGDQIWAFGEFATLGSIDPDLDTHHQIGELLELWKADRPELLRRFDLDKDGELNPQEWDLARAAARREVLRTQREALAASQAYVMRKPKSGKPYLITDHDPDVLARQFGLSAIVHGAVFIATAVALAGFYVHSGSGI